MESLMRWILVAVFVFFSACDTVEPDTLNASLPTGAIDVVVISYAADDFSGGFIKSAEFQVPSITQDILDLGIVIVHWQNFDTNRWHALPFELYGYDGTTERRYLYSYEYGLNSVTLRATKPGASAFPISEIAEGRIRVAVYI